MKYYNTEEREKLKLVLDLESFAIYRWVLHRHTETFIQTSRRSLQFVERGRPSKLFVENPRTTNDHEAQVPKFRIHGVYKL